MPVFSYLAHPVEGAKDKLMNEVKECDHCEVIPADNEDILIILTDTPDDDAEKKLWKKLTNLKSMRSLDMIFGHAGEDARKNIKKG